MFIFLEKKPSIVTTIYFHSSLKPLDIKCMKALHRKVNIIPIIAKADALTSDELVQMKNLVCQFENRNKKNFEIFYSDK